MNTTVKINCQAAIEIALEDLTPLQGELKELTDANSKKLKRSILKHGITFPFFVWQSEGKNYVIRDGIVVIPKGAIVLDGTVI